MKINLNKLFLNILMVLLWSLAMMPRLVLINYVPDLHGLIGIAFFAVVFWVNGYLLRANRLGLFLRVAIFVAMVSFVDYIWYAGMTEINFLSLVVYLTGVHLLMSLIPFEIRMIRSGKDIAICAKDKGSIASLIKALTDAGYNVKYVTPGKRFTEKILLLETRDVDWNGVPDKVLCLSGANGENPIGPEDIVEVVDEISGIVTKKD